MTPAYCGIKNKFSLASTFLWYQINSNLVSTYIMILKWIYDFQDSLYRKGSIKISYGFQFDWSELLLTNTASAFKAVFASKSLRQPKACVNQTKIQMMSLLNLSDIMNPESLLLASKDISIVYYANRNTCQFKRISINNSFKYVILLQNLFHNGTYCIIFILQLYLYYQL